METEIDERLGEHGFVGEVTFPEWVKGFSIIRDSAAKIDKQCEWIAPIPEERVEESRRTAQRWIEFLDRTDDADQS